MPKQGVRGVGRTYSLLVSLIFHLKGKCLFTKLYIGIGILLLNQLKLDYFLLLTENAVNCQSGKNESTYLGLKEVHREVLSDI